MVLQVLIDGPETYFVCGDCAEHFDPSPRPMFQGDFDHLEELATAYTGRGFGCELCTVTYRPAEEATFVGDSAIAFHRPGAA